MRATGLFFGLTPGTRMIALANQDQPPSKANPELPALNSQSLLERCMGDASAATQLLGMFYDRLPRSIAEISAELADLQGVAGTLRKVHTLKGNAGNLSAERLYLAASELESALRREEFADLPLRLQYLQQEAEAFRSAVPAVLETLS